MIVDDQPWMIVQEKVDVYDKQSAFIYCDRRQHLFVFNHPANRNTNISSTSSTTNLSDYSNTTNGRSTNTIHVQTVIYLERIQYIQRGGGGMNWRSARVCNQLRSIRQNSNNDPQRKLLEIFYSPDHPRSEYLYKSVSFQLTKREDEIDKWIDALYAVIDEAKNLNEAKKRNRWILREYEKLKRSSAGLTFDSINGWLNSHIGIVGEKNHIEKLIKQNEIFRQSNEITDSVFKETYNYFIDKQQEILIKNLMSDLIEANQILLEKFASRVTNNEINLVHHELDNIREFLRLENNQIEIPLQQCINYLWSEANSAFDPISRTKCTQNMDQPLNHYWISSSHNTYLAKTQLFNPASVHCYIQALLKGCRCVEIDVMDNRPGAEPEITHKNTRIKPIPLRDVVEAIQDYAFITSEYPIIISIENHCSPEQRSVMARMFIEIFGENLVQSVLSPNETCLPSPNQLKRKIILKDSKINNTLITTSQISIDSEDQPDIPSLGLEGPVQLYDFAKKLWFHYNYSFKNSDLFLAKDHERHIYRNLDDDFSDDESIENLSNNELTQIWYHGNMSHNDAKHLLLSNPNYEIGTFLIRKSIYKKCYCITFLALNSIVKSIEIREIIDEDGKCFYKLSKKKFESIPDLISHYRTYDFGEIIQGSIKTILHRLGKPLPRETWRQELERQSWYQPNLTRQQAEELLLGIGEEMTFLIRESSNRARQDYTISVYTNGSIRHSPIYRDGDGSDLMLMSLTFTSLIELVDYFSRKPIFQKLTLQKPAKIYSDFIAEQRQYEAQGIHKNLMIFKPLNNDISLKVDTLRTIQIDGNPNDRSIQVQLCIYEENKKRLEGYLLKFDTLKDWNLFLTKIYPTSPSSSSIHRSHDDIFTSTNTSGTNLTKTVSSSTTLDQSQICITELNKLIIYCQGVKLKEYNINKAQDLDKIRSFKEMISLNYVKAAAFCSDIRSMILFNQSHFTRIYPDFSRKSWGSYNFEPILYWLTGCQMVALNFQMPDRPMHINAGRFAANGGCGYVLMPKYIRSFDANMSKVDTVPMLLEIRVIAVRHLRTNQAKSILKVQIKTTIISNTKQKPAENQTYSTTINGPCGIWDSKQSSSKHHDQLHTYNRLHAEDSDVDLLYFEVLTENQEFCGQSAIPLSSLRRGIRSVQLYDKFNERLDMSALLVDIHFKTGICDS